MKSRTLLSFRFRYNDAQDVATTGIVSLEVQRAVAGRLTIKLLIPSLAFQESSRFKNC